MGRIRTHTRSTREIYLEKKEELESRQVKNGTALTNEMQLLVESVAWLDMFSDARGLCTRI